jgi:excisionase family DNA binding protein
MRDSNGGKLSRYVDAQEVAERFGISRSTVYRLVRVGKLTGRKIAGRVKIERASVDQYERLAGVTASLPYRMPGDRAALPRRFKHFSLD